MVFRICLAEGKEERGDGKRGRGKEAPTVTKLANSGSITWASARTREKGKKKENAGQKREEGKRKREGSGKRWRGTGFNHFSSLFDTAKSCLGGVKREEDGEKGERKITML